MSPVEMIQTFLLILKKKLICLKIKHSCYDLRINILLVTLFTEGPRLTRILGLGKNRVT